MKKIILALLFYPLLATLVAMPKILQPDEAFKVSMTQKANTVTINAELAKSIYLYKIK